MAATVFSGTSLMECFCVVARLECLRRPFEASGSWLRLEHLRSGVLYDARHLEVLFATLHSARIGNHDRLVVPEAYGPHLNDGCL